jgi:hypothetical protein
MRKWQASCDIQINNLESPPPNIKTPALRGLPYLQPIHTLNIHLLATVAWLRAQPYPVDPPNMALTSSDEPATGSSCNDQANKQLLDYLTTNL